MGWSPTEKTFRPVELIGKKVIIDRTGHPEIPEGTEAILSQPPFVAFTIGMDGRCEPNLFNIRAPVRLRDGREFEVSLHAMTFVDVWSEQEIASVKALLEELNKEDDKPL